MADFSDFPDGLKVSSNDSAGEISASVDETNRIRAALGLKPLKEGKSSAAAKNQEENEAHKRQQAEAAAKADAAELAARISEARERRTQEEKLRKTKTLGDEDPVQDDAEAWVERSRKVVEEKRRAEERRKAEEQRRRLEEQDDSDDDDDAPKAKGPKYSSKDLAGLKVGHGLEAMDAGESMILTLKDSRILAEEDLEEEDVLENVRVAELRKREKAVKASKKTTAFEETDDGWEKKTVLGKYDEEKDEGVSLDEQGAIDAAKKAKQEEIKRRLAVAAAGGVAALSGKEESADVSAAGGKAQSDFFTAAEMEQFNKPKKLRKKKSGRKKDALDTAELEAIVSAEAAADGEDGRGRSSDLGRRRDVTEAQAAAQKAAEEDKFARFEAAKSRAAADAAVAFKRGGAPEEPIGGDDDDADNELAAALERSRRAALAGQAAKPGGVDRVLETVKVVAAGGAGGVRPSASGANLDLDFSDTAEFVRNISVEKAQAIAQSAAERSRTGIVIPGVKDEPEPAAAEAEAEADGDTEMRDASAAEFVPLGGGGGDDEGEDGGAVKAEGGAAAAAAEQAGLTKEEEEMLVSVAEQAIGEEIKASKGLGSVLAMLKQKNQLDEAVTWSGRNNDKKPHRVKEKVEAEKIETADDKFKFGFSLDRYDEFGRKLTPKEAFRELCWRFHGMARPPGKMKQEKRLKQWAEEQRRLAMKEGDTPTGAMEKLREAQARVNAPYVILSGSVSAGQVSDSNSMYATLEKDAPAAAPLTKGALGIQQALTGKSKVEFMMNTKSNLAGKRAAGGGAAAGGMLPPPPKKPKAAP